MWCWLQWFWPQACYCCSAWHWSAVAGTSPSDAPRDQPDLVPYSSLWRPEGEEKDDICCTYSCCYDDCCCAYSVRVCVWERDIEIQNKRGRWEALYSSDSKWIHIKYMYFLVTVVACVIDLTTFTLLGCRGSSWTRTQTWTLQGKIFSSETCLLLQLALQHKHTNTVYALTYHRRHRKEDTKPKWNELLPHYRWNIHEVTDCMPQCKSEILLRNALSDLCLHRRSGIVIQKTKHKSINTRESVTTSHQLVLLRPYIMTLCLVFSPPPRLSLHCSALNVGAGCHYLVHNAQYIVSHRNQSCE